MWNTSDSVLDNVSQPEFEPEEVEGESVITDHEQLVSKLEREMRAAAERLDFERAAQIRDRILQLHNPTN